MDVLDWFLAAGIVLTAGVAFYFLLPPYGALIGLGLGLWMVYSSKKRRDKMRKS